LQRVLFLERGHVQVDRADIGLVADQHDRRVIAERPHMLQPVFGLLIGGVDLGSAVKQEDIEAAGAEKELVGGVDHDLTAEIPEMRNDLRARHLPFGNVYTRSHLLLARNHVEAVESADERGFACRAIAEKDHADAVEGTGGIAKAFQVGVDVRGFLGKDFIWEIDNGFEKFFICRHTVNATLEPVSPDVKAVAIISETLNKFLTSLKPYFF
jgi:hypothetical protein